MDRTAEQVDHVLAEPGSASSREEEVNLKEVLSILRRRKWLIAGTIALITGLMALYVFNATPRYTANLKLVFDPAKQKVISFDTAISGQLQDEATLLSEIEVLESRNLALRVIDKLGLNKDPEFNAQLVPPGRVTEWLVALFPAPEASYPEPPPPFTVANEEDPPATQSTGAADPPVPGAGLLTAGERRTLEQERVIDKFLDRLVAARAGESRAVAVKFTSTDPWKAAVVVNTIGDLFLVERLEGKLDNARRASKWLAEHVQLLRQQVNDAEAKVEDYRRDHNLLQGERVTLITEQISNLSQQLSEARRVRIGAEANIGQARSMLADPSKLATAADVLDSNLIQRLRGEQAGLSRREAAMGQELGLKHPQVLQLREEKERLATEIKGEVGKIITSLENKAETARRQEAAITADLEELKAQMGEANEASVGLNSLEREANAKRLMFEKFMSAFMQTSAEQDVESQLPDARIISPAAAPDRPSFPRKALMIAGSFGSSVIIALLLALFREQLDRGFRSAEQVEGQTGLPVIAHVPLIEAGRGTVPAEYVLTHPDSAFGGAIRSIFTRLLLMTPGRPPQVILVTSSQPGEGKTSVSLALARLQAKAGRKVILLDADFRKPQIAKLIGVPGAPGLIELISGKAGFEEVIRTDKSSGANVIASGTYGQDALTTFALGQMGEVVERLRSSYDFIIIDSAPVLVNSDAHALSAAADETLLIVRWGFTRREVVRFAVKQLRGLANRLGIVLSMFDAKKSARYNYGDSGYYFGKARKYYSQ